MTEKITGLRFEITVTNDVASNHQFVDRLKNKMDQDLPKFKIQKIALESNWQSASNFVCLVHSKQVRTVDPVFNMEFDGFMLTSTKKYQNCEIRACFGRAYRCLHLE